MVVSPPLSLDTEKDKGGLPKGAPTYQQNIAQKNQKTHFQWNCTRFLSTAACAVEKQSIFKCKLKKAPSLFWNKRKTAKLQEARGSIITVSLNKMK